MLNDYLTNTVVTCDRCGNARLTVNGENATCEVCGRQAGETDSIDSSGWDRIWRTACAESIRYKRL